MATGRNWIMKLGVFFVVILVIFLRYYSTRPIYQSGQKIRMTTKVTTEPIVYEDSQYLKVEGLKIYLPKYPTVFYGDHVVVEGIVEEKEGKGTYLRSAKLIGLQETKGILSRVREKLIDFYHRSLPQPHSSLISGMVIGSKANIPADFWDALKKTGTAHVVVASGMNVTLVAGFLTRFLILFLPRKKAVVLALIGIWVYALIAGFDAPIIRAAIMGSLAFSAVGLGRINLAWRALFISAAVMLILKPGWITDLGFILSFTATVSLMLFGKFFQKIVEKLAIPTGIKEGLYTSLAAQVLVAPILYVTFGYFSIWSPLINALVIWTVVYLTQIGLIAGLAGLVWFDAGRLTLYLTYPLTSWFIWVVKHAG